MTDEEIRTLLDRYVACMNAKDWAGVRALLADDLKFRGALNEFDDAEAFIESFRAFEPHFGGIEVETVFTRGDQACMIYGFVTTTPIGTTPTAETHVVRDSKIVSIRSYFDARPYVPFLEQLAKTA